MIPHPISPATPIRAHVLGQGSSRATHVFALVRVAAHAPTLRYTLAGFPPGNLRAGRAARSSAVEGESGQRDPQLITTQRFLPAAGAASSTRLRLGRCVGHPMDHHPSRSPPSPSTRQPAMTSAPSKERLQSPPAAARRRRIIAVSIPNHHDAPVEPKRALSKTDTALHLSRGNTSRSKSRLARPLGARTYERHETFATQTPIAARSPAAQLVSQRDITLLPPNEPRSATAHTPPTYTNGTPRGTPTRTINETARCKPTPTDHDAAGSDHNIERKKRATTGDDQ